MTPGVVVVAYGAPELLIRCLAGVEGEPVVVVDNSSDPQVREVSVGAGARYVDPGSNLGFAGGVNVGLAELLAWRGPGDVLLLNPDAVTTPDQLAALHRELHREARTAAVAPLLQGPDGAQRPAWPWPSPLQMWLEAVGLSRFHRDRQDFLVGAVLLLSAAALADVGGFDERFFLYGEESDWQRRAVDAGWSVRLAPDVTVLHVGAGTSTDETRRQALFCAGGETYVRKWFGARGWASYRLAALTGALLRSGLPGSRGAADRRRAGLYARGPRRVAGLEA